jgi:LysM repeat protein
MTLAPATIKLDTGQEIRVRYNPNQYSLDQSNQFNEIAIPGRSAPIMQYNHGNPRTLAMELFFDTYEQQTDVRDYTDLIYGLLSLSAKRPAPPICTFVWGNGCAFRGVLERVSGKFTLFLADGTPVRATLNVSFKEYRDVAQIVAASASAASSQQQVYTVKQGDTLSGIAAQQYGDAAGWLAIAEENGIDDPRAGLEPGRVLKIPPQS